MPATTIKQFDSEELRFNPPHFGESVLRDFLEEQYGITGSFKSLAGERDLNIRVTTEEGNKYIYKISSPDEFDETVDFQIKALLHLEVKDPGLAVPRLIQNKDDKPSCTLKDEDGKPHHVRLLSFVDGIPLDSFDDLSYETIKEVGRITGRLCVALKDFKHPAAKNFMPWDTMNGLIFSDELRQKYVPDDIKNLVEDHLERLQNHGVSKILALPHQVIHNDGHSGNVICAIDKPEIVTGVIDFGDMLERPIIVDVAVSLISMISHNSDILGTTSAMLEGYQKHTPIPEDQLELLYDALAAVTILCVQLLNYRAIHHAYNKQKLEEEDFEGMLETAKVFLNFDKDVFTNHVMGR